MTRPKVLIIGAGFAGLNAAKTLKNAPVDVLIVDQHNYHTFQPLLYQVATTGLAIDDIAHQVRDIFHRQRNVRFRQGIVVGVDWGNRVVQLGSDDQLPFDFLIVGAGAVYNDFGTPGVGEHAFYLKSLSEATNIRSHILRQFERASAHPELIDEGILNFVIVGGGPTGVEMAGTMSELFERVLPRDYPELDLTQAHIILVEAAAELLTPFSPKSRRYAEKVLARRGVELRLGSSVAEVRADAAVLKGGSAIPTRTVIWAAGVRGHPLVDALEAQLTRGYRLAVEDNLALAGKPFAFAADDIAGASDARGRSFPQVAQVAIQQGKHAAREVVRQLRNEAPRRFHYADKGIMAIIGRNAGVAELTPRLGGFKLRGFLGWLGWLFIHLIYLPGHQNHVNAFTNWIYNYVTFDRHARLIAEMAPSPAEVTDHASRPVAPEAVAEEGATRVQEAAENEDLATVA